MLWCATHQKSSIIGENMFEDNQEMRKMALAITHYAYRNTSLEDYHSECIKMGKPFYTKVYNIVYKKLKKVKR